jgi:hypothetical protein
MERIQEAIALCLEVEEPAVEKLRHAVMVTIGSECIRAFPGIAGVPRLP